MPKTLQQACTPLGLAAVYGIVKQSGGEITVSSRPGQGTTFRLFFPRVDLATPEESPAGPTDLPRGHETILVVEDEEPVRELVCLVLEESGYRVLAAEGAEQARAIVEQYDGAIHLVLADVVMPGGSGRQLVEDLLAQRPGLRVLYTSGYTDDVVLRHGVRNAEVDFLPKPFGSAELARKVREMLDGERP